MCGIAGAVRWERPIDEEDVKRVSGICRELEHRGPDGCGIVRRVNAVLGHRRLAIIDLSDAGRQPMESEDGSIWTVCNGEIYNHRDLRAELEGLGHAFASSCDSEVLVHGYEAWGLEGLVTRLRGMFAFAVWDERARTLWLVRDRLGVKPLYAVVARHHVIFSSEIRPLYKFLPVTVDAIDPVALDCYLAFGYVPPDMAIVHGIEKIPPATAMKWTPAGRSSVRYWAPARQAPKAWTDGDLDEALDEALHEAVRVRLESDVPLGCFLSGGIDSGLVAGLASAALATPLTTVSAGFEGEDDELPLARLVAERYETRHHELTVSADRVQELPALTRLVGEPYADTSLLPMAAVCQAARRDVTVALTGDGGDELFGGYYRVVASAHGDAVRRFLGRSLAGRLSQVLKAVRRPAAVRRVTTVLKYASQSLPDLIAEYAAVFDTASRAALYRPEWTAGREVLCARGVIADRAREFDELTPPDAYVAVDLEFRLPGRYLVKVDMASSGVALECRSPFLDQHLVEFALGIPLRTRLRRWRQKGLLRSVAGRHLPREVVRGRKRGFEPGIGPWLRGVGGDFMQSLLPFQVGAVDGPLHGPALERLLIDHRAGRADHSSRLWSILCFELWWRAFVGTADQFRSA